MAENGKILVCMCVAVCVPLVGHPQVRVPDRMTVDNALEFAWYNHPRMKEAQGLVASVHGAKVQAGLWPRPELGVESMKKSDVEKSTGVFLAQKLELGGKVSARVGVADAMVFARETELLDKWLELRADIKESYARLAYAVQVSSLLGQKAEADAENEKLSASLYSAGKLDEQELIDARKEAAMSKAAAAAAKIMLENIEREVLFAAGLGTNSVSARPVCSESGLVVMPDAEALLAAAMTNNPSVREARAGRLLADARERLAKTSRWPDLTLRAEYMRVSMSDKEGNGGSVMASVDLPLFNRGQGDRIQALEEKRAAVAAEEAVRAGIGAKISELVGEYRRKSADEEYFRQTAVPLSEKKHALNENSWKMGRLSRRDSIRSLGELIKVKLDCAEARLMAETVGIELERLAPAVVPSY